jgi:hypothetical protein
MSSTMRAPMWRRASSTARIAVALAAVAGSVLAGQAPSAADTSPAGRDENAPPRSAAAVALDRLEERAQKADA